MSAANQIDLFLGERLLSKQFYIIRSAPGQRWKSHPSFWHHCKSIASAVTTNDGEKRETRSAASCRRERERKRLATNIQMWSFFCFYFCTIVHHAPVLVVEAPTTLSPILSHQTEEAFIHIRFNKKEAKRQKNNFTNIPLPTTTRWSATTTAATTTAATTTAAPIITAATTMADVRLLRIYLVWKNWPTKCKTKLNEPVSRMWLLLLLLLLRPKELDFAICQVVQRWTFSWFDMSSEILSSASLSSFC